MNIKPFNKDLPFLIPQRGSEHAAGYDLFYAGQPVMIQPMQRMAMPTNIVLEIPIGSYGRIAPRSGLAFKNGIDVLGGVIDCFSGDSVIKTIEGDKLVKDLKINEVVLSVNDQLEIENDFISAIISLGDKEVLVIETEDGVLEVTAGTLIYTDSGIKEAKNLKIEDKILFYEINQN
jgi:dUTPase